MDDPVNLVVWTGTVATLGKLTLKVLGPPADSAGAALRLATERQAHNFARVMKHAVAKLGPRVERPGIVAPRVLKELLLEAPFCEDELSAEYFGGVLAAARGDSPRDDRAASFISLIGSLSTYELRTHYILYASFRRLFCGRGADLGSAAGRRAMRMFVPLSEYVRAMCFTADEDIGTILEHSIPGLAARDLIASSFWGVDTDPSAISAGFPRAEEGGIVAEPCARGVQLYLWAHGRGDVETQAFLDPSVPLTFETTIEIPEKMMTCGG